jgi:hypothetical protein
MARLLYLSILCVADTFDPCSVCPGSNRNHSSIVSYWSVWQTVGLHAVCHFKQYDHDRRDLSRLTLSRIVAFQIHHLTFFYVLLTAHLGIILINNQLDAQFFFLLCLFQFSACFEQHRAHHQENQLYQYTFWYMSLCVGDRQCTQVGKDLLYWYNWFSWWWARGCLKHVENWNKHVKKNCASSWLFIRITPYSSLRVFSYFIPKFMCLECTFLEESDITFVIDCKESLVEESFFWS